MVESKIWLLVRVYEQSHYTESKYFASAQDATEVLGAYETYEDAEKARKILEDEEDKENPEIVEADNDDDEIEFSEDDDDDEDNHYYDILEVTYHSVKK